MKFRNLALIGLNFVVAIAFAISNRDNRFETSEKDKLAGFWVSKLSEGFYRLNW